MKNYLYYFEFFSGFYESYFYRQVQANNEEDAIVQCLSYFKDLSEEDVTDYLNDTLDKNWNARLFWDNVDTRFTNSDGTVGYNLIWVKEIEMNLSHI